MVAEKTIETMTGTNWSKTSWDLNCDYKMCLRFTSVACYILKWIQFMVKEVYLPLNCFPKMYHTNATIDKKLALGPNNPLLLKYVPNGFSVGHLLSS